MGIYEPHGKELRTHWEFEYTASVLAGAAKKKAEYRFERLNWWRKMKNAVMEEVRSKGLTVEESVSDKYASSNASRGHGPRVTIDMRYQRRLDECFEKIEAHDMAARELRGWVQVLEANKEARLKLTHNDWLYFFGDDKVIQGEKEEGE